MTFDPFAGAPALIDRLHAYAYAHRAELAVNRGDEDHAIYLVPSAESLLRAYQREIARLRAENEQLAQKIAATVA